MKFRCGGWLVRGQRVLIVMSIHFCSQDGPILPAIAPTSCGGCTNQLWGVHQPVVGGGGFSNELNVPLLGDGRGGATM